MIISFSILESIKSKVEDIEREFNIFLDRIEDKNISISEIKRTSRSLMNKIYKINLFNIEEYADLDYSDNPVLLSGVEDSKRILKSVSDMSEELQNILDNAESEDSYEKQSSRINSILDGIRSDYSLIKRSQLPSSKMVPDDILLNRIKNIEGLIHKLDLGSLETEVYDELIDIKNDISELKREIISQAKSRKYVPLLKPALRSLMKKHNIIFNAYPYNEEASEEKFDEIIDFLEIPKALDFYENVIKRIINYTISEKSLRAFIESVEVSMRNRSFLHESFEGNFREFMFSLNENYATQMDIESFVDDLIIMISERVLSALNDIKEGKGINRYIKIPYSSIDFSKYPEIEKYTDSLKGEGIRIFFRRRSGELSGARGSFNKSTGDINIYFPLEEFSHLIDLDTILTAGQIELLLSDKSLDNISLRESLIHEVQHAFDSWRSGGKAFSASRHISGLSKIEKLRDEGDSESAFTEYINLSPEISARITQIVSKLKFTHMGEIIPLKDFIFDFIREFRSWERLSEKNKRVIIRKISGIWQKKTEDMKTNESSKEAGEKPIKIMPLEKYLRINEDFYNPFSDDYDSQNAKVVSHLSDQGRSLNKYKKTFNLNKVEWGKKGGSFILRSKTSFNRGDIIEIAPVIPLDSASKKNESIKDIIFEIDREKGEYALVLGYGPLYGHNPQANVEYSYNRSQRAMYFIARTYIKPYEELNINYGTDYWAEREMANSIKNIDSIAAEADAAIEESEIQPNISDLEQGKVKSQFSIPNSQSNPAVSGVAIKGVGQQ